MRNLSNILEQQFRFRPKSNAQPVDIPSDYFDDDTSVLPINPFDRNSDDNSGADNEGGNEGGGLANVLRTPEVKKVGELTYKSEENPILNDFKKEAIEDADDYTEGHISIEKGKTSPSGKDRVVLVGKTLAGINHFFKVAKGPSGKWGWVNDAPDEGDNKWREFSKY